jgi:hypothetical protein
MASCQWRDKADHHSAHKRSDEESDLSAGLVSWLVAGLFRSKATGHLYLSTI